MKSIRSILVLSIFTFLIACGGGKQKSDENTKSDYIAIENMNMSSLEKEIKKREAALNEDSNTVDGKKAEKVMEVYAIYAEKFGNYEGASERLFKAGELAMGLGKTVQAIKYFEKVYNEYPNYEKRAYALFMKAFVLENQAMQYDQAKAIYEQFIRDYPTHPMADDAEYSIKNMGKSPEELIREFEKRDSLEKAQKQV